MKVVLFCGGLGLRLRDYSEKVPKAMVPIGYRPVIWHVMKYYAHFGHKEFILCLGYGADAIKEYFLRYDECVSNDFVLTDGGKQIKLLNADIQDWKITFVDTGIQSTVGQRLKSVEEHIGKDEAFLANYTDGLTDLPHMDHLAHFRARNVIASCLCITPRLSMHQVTMAGDGRITRLDELSHSRIRVNGGYFIFKREIFKYICEGEELVHAPFQRLIKEDQLVGYTYNGFWAAMDTFKDKMLLDDLYARGKAPWAVWRERQNLSLYEECA
ncbi:Glucose-1-phosphate cytidylyltransferase [Nitrospira sp. KM1]|uniref:sugar phosphate nucleotidyltransferase n=1 Tax=Nitrospira sp. KM1 TaxID=1936990 RepID=UPI0013A74C02|nr:sugar phosphate nucleotidyltransferase [Nitrospira sp. KM1]BCA53697.1 Glucose-1-phosphate cytidylyltransferase [Nitrospira sp. KM1]